MSRPYVLTKGAADDLSAVIRHSLQHWGRERTRTYVMQLEAAVIAVAADQGVYKDLSSVYPMLRMAKSGKHFIFCLPRVNNASLVLAILHERMDMIERLKVRLDEH